MDKNCKFNLCSTSPKSIAHYRFTLLGFWSHINHQSYSNFRNYLVLVRVFEYSMCHDQNTQKFLSQIADCGDVCSSIAFNTADAEVRFELVFKTFSLPHLRFKNFNFEFDKWILKFFQLLLEVAWLLIQKLSTLGQGMK